MAMEIRPELYDKLKSLKIEAYRYDDQNGGIVTFRGPTWTVNPKTPLDSFIEDFISDEHGAMRDYAALPSMALSLFFTDPDLLDRKAYKRNFQPVDPETLIIHPDFRPIPGFNYFFGGDLSVRGDATGICLVYYDWLNNRIVMPVNVRITSKGGDRIDYSPIIQFIYNLRDRGFNIKKCAFDQFQSNSTILELNSHDIPAAQLNYADTFVGCTQLQELIYTDKFVYFMDQEEFIGEAKHLVLVNSKRIDHPSTGPWKNRKDNWDAAVNASVCAIEDYYKNGNMTQENQKVSGLVDKLLVKETSGSGNVRDIWDDTLNSKWYL